MVTMFVAQAAVMARMLLGELIGPKRKSPGRRSCLVTRLGLRECGSEERMARSAGLLKEGIVYRDCRNSINSTLSMPPSGLLQTDDQRERVVQPVWLLQCVIRGATAGRHGEPSAARKQLRRPPLRAHRVASPPSNPSAKTVQPGIPGAPAISPAYSTRQPRHHVRLSPRHRRCRDHRHRPFRAGTSDLSLGRPHGPIRTAKWRNGVCGWFGADRSGGLQLG